jgi:hypothetical protein
MPRLPAFAQGYGGSAEARTKDDERRPGAQGYGGQAPLLRRRRFGAASAEI